MGEELKYVQDRYNLPVTTLAYCAHAALNESRESEYLLDAHDGGAPFVLVHRPQTPWHTCPPPVVVAQPQQRGWISWDETINWTKETWDYLKQCIKRAKEKHNGNT